MSSSQSSAVGGGGGDGGHFESGADADIEARPLIPKGGDEVYGGIDAPAEQQRGELADQAAGFLASKNIGWLMELEPDDLDGSKELAPLT